MSGSPEALTDALHELVEKLRAHRPFTLADVATALAKHGFTFTGSVASLSSEDEAQLHYYRELTAREQSHARALTAGYRAATKAIEHGGVGVFPEPPKDMDPKRWDRGYLDAIHIYELGVDPATFEPTEDRYLDIDDFREAIAVAVHDEPPMREVPRKNERG